MIEIDGILLDNELIKSKFACDLGRCKGACCTFPGDSGAPLSDEDIKDMQTILEKVKPYLNKRSLKVIDETGFYQKDDDGDLSTACIDGKDCVFVIYDGDIAKCAIEKSYFNGDIKYRKPLSCHLFPIREGYYGGKYLYYEKFQECIPGMRKGEKEGIPLLESLKEPLSRAYGDDWLSKVNEKLKQI